MSKTLTITDLIKMVTGDFVLTDDRGTKFVYSHSKPARDLLAIGKKEVNKIGTYLKDLEKILKDCLPEEIHQAKGCWILLLWEMNDKKPPEMNMSISPIYFNTWVEWACNCKPD